MLGIAVVSVKQTASDARVSQLQLAAVCCTLDVRSHFGVVEVFWWFKTGSPVNVLFGVDVAADQHKDCHVEFPSIRFAFNAFDFKYDGKLSKLARSFTSYQELLSRMRTISRRRRNIHHHHYHHQQHNYHQHHRHHPQHH